MAGLPQSGYDLLQAYGYDVLGDYLRLEQDLLSRYVDYEEMDDYPEIAAAVDIFADDSTQPDTQINRTVWVTSPDKNIQNALNELFQKRLRIDEEIWEIARTLVKYGNDYEEVLVTPQGVMGLNFLPPPTVRRIEGPRGELFGFIQDFQGRFGYSPEEFKNVLARRTAALQGRGQDSYGMQMDPTLNALEDWEVVHFRLRGKHRRSIYGFSALEAARWIFKRLILLEDSAIIYRLQRAPERFAFYVDVGDLPPAEALAYVNRVRQQYKKRKYVNPSTGKLDLKFDPLSQDEDFFLPSRQGQDGTRVDVLAGPQWQHMEDIEYFQNKLFSAMKIPKAYLAQDENTARAVLSTEDVRFARSVLRIQRELQNGLRKVARIHLAAIGLDPHKADYDIHMTVPSSIFELAQLEVRNARADLAGRMKEFMPFYWIYKRIFSLSDDEIQVLTKQREEDVLNEALWGAKAEAAAQKLAQGGEQQAMPVASGKRELGASRKIIVPGQVSRGGARGISERELMAGYSKEVEKRLDDKLDRLLKGDRQLEGALRELGDFVQVLARSHR
jgi:hypothetical protein